MIRIGVLGCGQITRLRHLPEYKNNSNVKIVGLYDIHYDRALELAGMYDVKAYENYMDLLADESIDAVSVCTPNHTHCYFTLEALKHNKHVLVEKPMSIDLDEAVEMVKTAQKYNKNLMVGQNQRMTKAHIKAKELIEAGEIGKVLSFKTTFGHSGPENWSITKGNKTWFFDKNKAVMGSMADLGVHKLDLIYFLTGQRIREIFTKSAVLDKRGPDGSLIEVDDNSISMITLESGAIGTMTSSWTYYAQEDNSTFIYGSKGQIELYRDDEYSLIVKKSDEEIKYKLEAIQTNDNQTSTGIIDEFISSIMDNRQPSISGEDVLITMKAVFSALESAKSGEAVRINYEQ